MKIIFCLMAYCFLTPIFGFYVQSNVNVVPHNDSHCQHFVITESTKIFSSLYIPCPEIGISDSYDVLMFLLLLT